MNGTLLKILLTGACCLAAIRMAAHDGDTVAIRSTAKAVTIEYGGVRSVDTYLSPLRYRGGHARIGFESWRALTKRPELWARQLQTSVTYDSPENPAGNNRLHTLLFELDFRMLARRGIAAAEGLTLYAGGGVGFDGGVTYNPRNSNNVCSPQVYLHADASGMAVWRTAIGRLPVTLRYQAAIPVAGCYYLPDYDQSFYEIYLGNYGPAVNFGWWGNRFDMENVLSADLHTKRAIWRIGYRNELTTLWKNNISVRRTVHSLVVGVAWESIAFDPRRGGTPWKARAISAFY